MEEQEAWKNKQKQVLGNVETNRLRIINTGVEENVVSVNGTTHCQQIACIEDLCARYRSECLTLFPHNRSVRIDVTCEETGTNNWVTCGAEVQTQAF